MIEWIIGVFREYPTLTGFSFGVIFSLPAGFLIGQAWEIIIVENESR